MHVVYVQASTKDPLVRAELVNFYIGLRPRPDGLTYSCPVLDKHDRDMTLARCPEIAMLFSDIRLLQTT